MNLLVLFSVSVMYVPFASAQDAARQNATQNGLDLVSIGNGSLRDGTKTPKSDNKEFVIIRRDGLSCYLIESTSLQVAKQIEGLIEHK